MSAFKNLLGGNRQQEQDAVSRQEAETTRAVERMRVEKDFSAECRRWLDDHHVTKSGMTTPERMKAMADYRDMLKKSLRKSEVAPKDWANSLKTSYIDGEILFPMQIKLASEALGEVWENRQCRPAE